MSAGRKKLVLLAAGIAFALVAFELVLQVRAYWNWQTGQREQSVEGAATRVLCVGDSFTWGLGAADSSGAYPAQLEQRLRVAGHDVGVVNGGWPGQNSRDVAMKLPRQLELHLPQLVYVLIGTNDAWKPPPPVTIEACRAADRGSFSIVWRTARMFALAKAWLFGGATEGRPADTAFVGTWHTADRELTFEPDGRFLADDTEMRWVVADGRLRILLPNHREADVAWQRDGERLVLHSTLWQGKLELQRGPLPERSPLARARALLAAQDYARAIPLLERCLDQQADEVGAREALVGAWVRKGEPRRAERHLDALRARYRDAADTEVGEALAHALVAAGALDEAMQVAGAVFAGDPSSVRAAQVLMGAGLAAGKGDEVDRAFQGVIDALKPGSPRRIELLMTLAILRKSRPEDSLQCILQACVEGGEESVVRQYLFAGRADFTAERLATCLGRMAIDGAQRRRLRRVYDEALEGPRRANDVLAEHLQVIVELCRERDAVPVLLTYPNDYPGHDDVVRRVAGERDVDWIAVRPAFEAALRTRPRDELYIPDGHCTSAGYGIIADLAARDAAKRIQ